MDQAGENPRGPHAQIVLSANEHFTLDSLIGAAYDPYLTGFARLIPGLIAAQDKVPDPALADAVQSLRGWDYKWSLTSTQTSLAVFWGEALWKAVARTRREDLVYHDCIAHPDNDQGITEFEYYGKTVEEKAKEAPVRAERDPMGHRGALHDPYAAAAGAGEE